MGRAAKLMGSPKESTNKGISQFFVQVEVCSVYFSSYFLSVSFNCFLVYVIYVSLKYFVFCGS